jgi:hypothetical protein
LERWAFLTQSDEYHLEIDAFFKSPASTVDWLAHLQEKPGFDARAFCEMMHRFRAATNGYDAL